MRAPHSGLKTRGGDLGCVVLRCLLWLIFRRGGTLCSLLTEQQKRRSRGGFDLVTAGSKKGKWPGAAGAWVPRRRLQGATDRFSAEDKTDSGSRVKGGERGEPRTKETTEKQFLQQFWQKMAVRVSASLGRREESRERKVQVRRTSVGRGSLWKRAPQLPSWMRKPSELQPRELTGFSH